jgi:hypothetical protein
MRRSRSRLRSGRLRTTTPKLSSNAFHNLCIRVRRVGLVAHAHSDRRDRLFIKLMTDAVGAFGYCSRRKRGMRASRLVYVRALTVSADVR